MCLRLFVLLACLSLAPLPLSANSPAPAATSAPVSPLPAAPECSTTKWGAAICIRPAHFARDTCSAIESFATRHQLDVGFFARLIWQESRFDPNAVSHAGAQGIAQFMPFTARKRGLADAFNPAEALDHSAEYLSEMAQQFGNLGLAAIGYNAGEHRVEALLKDGRRPPPETRQYVQIITGLPYQNWTGKSAPDVDLRLDEAKPFLEACTKIAKARRLSAPKRRPEKAVPFQVAGRVAVLSPLAPATSHRPKLRPKRRAPWGVQLAFGTSRADALRKYKQATRRCRKQIGAEQPDLISVKNRVSGKRGFVMARLGRDSLNAARKFCIRLNRAGCTCRVYRNEK